MNDKKWVAAIHCIQDDTDQTKITYQQILTHVQNILIIKCFIIFHIVSLIY